MDCAEQLEHFSLRWNNFNDNMKTGFHDLLTREDFVDVTIAAEGKLIQAHRMVLSICSPYFRNIFKANPCQHPIVFLKDVTHKELTSILQFMYLGEVSVQQEELGRFLRTAEALQIKGLTSEDEKERQDDVVSSKHNAFREERQHPRFASNIDNSNRLKRKLDYSERTSLEPNLERMNVNREASGLSKVNAPIPKTEKSEENLMNCDNSESAVLVKSEPQDKDFYNVDHDEYSIREENMNCNDSQMQDSCSENIHDTPDVSTPDFPKTGNVSGVGNDRCYKLKMIADELTGSGYDGCNFAPVLTKNQGLCPICGRILQHKKNLQTHITDQHSGIIKCWSCRICNKVCKTWSALRVHKSRHHAKLNTGPPTLPMLSVPQRIQ